MNLVTVCALQVGYDHAMRRRQLVAEVQPESDDRVVVVNRSRNKSLTGTYTKEIIHARTCCKVDDEPGRPGLAALVLHYTKQLTQLIRRWAGHEKILQA